MPVGGKHSRPAPWVRSIAISIDSDSRGSEQSLVGELKRIEYARRTPLSDQCLIVALGRRTIDEY
jgi:hypothetical protein